MWSIRGVAEFQRCEYAAAKKDLEQNASDLFNTPYFDVASINKIESDPAFGRISRTVSGTERHMQLALRFMF